MNHNEIELLKNLERARVRSLVTADMETAKKLHAEDFQLITPIGISLTKEQYLGAIITGAMKYNVWEPLEIDVRLYGDVALVRYQADLEIVFHGQKIPLCRYWHTDSYERKDNAWQVVWSQATGIINS